MAKVRVKPWEGAVAVSHPETGQFIVPDRSQYYQSTDPLVKAHPWLFASDSEIEAGYDGETARPTEVRVTRKRGQ